MCCHLLGVRAHALPQAHHAKIHSSADYEWHKRYIDRESFSTTSSCWNCCKPIMRTHNLVCTSKLSQIKEGASATLTENLVQSNGGAGVLIHADCGGSMVRNDVKDNTGGQVISHAPERRFVIG